MSKPDFCPVVIAVTEEELCNADNLISNFQALENIAEWICCVDDEINAFSSRKVKPGDNIQFITIGGTAWAWTGPDGFTSALQNPIILNSDSNAQGLYTVTITDGDCTHVRQVYVFIDQPVLIEDDLINLPDPSTIDEGTIFIDAALKTAKILGGGSWVDFPLADTRAIVDQGSPISPPPLTGNITHLGEFVAATDNMIYYIDLLGNSLKFSGTNIFNADGTILANRVVTGDGKSVTWNNLLSWTLQAQTKIAWNSTTGAYQFVVLPPQDDTQTRVLAVDSSGNLVWIDKATVFGPPELINDQFYISATPFVCVGDNIELFANGPSGSTYAWTGPNSFASGTQNPTILSTGIGVETGNYICTITHAATGLIRVKQVYVQIVNCAPPEAFIS